MRTTKEIKKGLLLVVFICLNTLLFAQKYWVGGQGNWNDVNHWSITSGGASGASVPNLNDDVIFDANSGLSNNDFVNITGISYANGISFSGLNVNVRLTGDESNSLIVNGRIVSSPRFINEFKGSVAMTGINSDFKYKKFEAGEFFGKQGFSDVYKDKYIGVRPLIVSSVDTTIVDATCGPNGSITLSPNDGVGPFSYDWYPKPITGDGSNSVSDLAPGRYTCVIYDLSDGLPFIVSDIQVDGPSPLTISLVPPIDSVDCNGGADGELTLLVFGGVQPYTYTWDDPTAQANMTTLFLPPSSQRLSVPGLSAGSYSLNVTDDVGCSEDGPTWSIEEPILLTSSITDTTHVFCFSDCTGDATVTPAGGTPGYTGYVFSWYDAPGMPTTAQATNLCQGTYHVEVTDGKGCLDTAEVTISQPTELQASIASFTDVQCFGANDGTADAGVLGGTAPYTYDWYDKAPTATTPGVTNLAPGTYNVEVTDFSGCLDTAQVLITEPTLLTSSITDTVHILCNGDATGEAEVTPAGGTSGYSYTWYDGGGSTAQRLTGVIAGTYNVEVEDDNGCLDTSTVTITQPSSVLSSSITDTTHNICFGDCNGIAIVTPAGGTTGYTYDWYDAPGGITDSTVNNLCAGTFNVEVTDGNGCLDTSVVTITEPDELTATTTLAMVDCKSNCNGEIDLNPTGGVTTYSFDWYDAPGAPTSEDVTNLCAGTYNVEITDINGCLDTVTAIITEPDTMVTGILSLTNILCNGDETGDAAVTQVGGVAPYNYSWYDAPSDPGTSIINNLPAGTYNVEVTDDNGCSDTSQVILTEPALPLSSSISDTVHIICKDACTGEAEALAVGGVTTYNYDWYDVPGVPTTDRVTGLCDGTYHVEITDLNGCLDTSEVIITEPLAGVTIAINDSANANCNGICDGWALATYSGGTGTLNLDWYSAGNQITDTAFNLCAGAAYVEVTDDNGCADTAVVFIEEPAVMVVTINSATLPTCFGDCDGEMSVTPSGGTFPYLYSWYDAVGTPTTPSASGQCAGAYNIRVEDNNGCVDTTLVILSQPDSLEHTIDTQVNLPCKNDCKGIAAMTPIGGTSPYTITWYDVPGLPTGDSLSTLCAGTWNFELRDNNGCLDTGTVTLTEPALELTSSITDTTHNVCFGECNGDATVLGVGGTGLITYDWYNSPDGDTDPIAENLCAGTYDVEVEDANGCLDTASVIITEPTDLVLVGSVTTSACGSLDTSSASVAVSGGIAPYTYDWYDAGNVTNDTVTDLSAGTYHCEVTDFNGCVDTVEVIISPAAPLIASIRNDTTHVTCFGLCNGAANALVTGGVAPFNYDWFDSPRLRTTSWNTGLCADTFHVAVEDLFGCKDTAQVIIREPTLLVSSTDSLEASCFGVCDGRAWVDYSGGTSPYDVDWLNSGNQTTDTINAVCTGTYQVEITDANGCLDTSEVTVTAPIVVTSSITDTTHLLCYNDCNGSAIVTPVGGTTPYTYSWFNAPGLETDSTANNLCFGTYNVEVRDNNGCLDTSEVSITSASPQITAVMDSVLTLCIGSADGEAIVNSAGGILPHTYDWYDGGNQTNDTATGLIIGTYNVEVTDNVGCIDTFAVGVTEPDTLRAIISDTTHLVCFGDSNGIAISTPIGGNAPYTYSWFDAPTVSTDSTVTGLPAGTFQVEVTDANGCTDTGIVTITQPTVIALGSDSIQATCTGICTGAAIVVPSGGVGPYSFDWYDAGNIDNDTVSALCAGFYNVEVTDANGCIDSLEVEVTEPITITATPVDSSAAFCHNTNEGWAAITGVGGTAPYSFWWDDPLNQTNDTATVLFGGVYRAAVTDLNGCSDTVSITVNSPDSILPNDSLVNISCKDACDGFIRIAVSGGTKGAGYTHSWNTLSVDTFLTNLCPGTYVDTITDGIGCVDTFSFVITEPDSLYAIFSDTTDVTCSYSSNGQAIVTPTGGTPIYTYDWYDVPGGDVDSVASGITPGTYHVEVTDANGCLDTGEIVISSPAPIVMTTDSVESTCSGICNGIAIISTAGGTAPYTYDWFENGNDINDSIYNLCADTFSVAVVDSNGCRDTADVIVTQPVTVTASIVDTNQTTCYLGADGWAVIAGAGGTAPYTYWWNDPLNQTNDTAVGLVAGTYRAAVTDFNGCSDTIDVVIEQPSSWAHVKDSTAASCYEVCDGIITITPGGGNGAPYTHTWSNGSSSPTIIGLCDGIYTDTIADALGCLDTISVEITQPDSLQALPLLIQNVVCFGDSTGMARGTGLGGTSPYSYEWGDPVMATTDTFFTAPADTFRVIITDANGCKDTNGIRVNEPTQLVTSIVDTIHANCICNAEATVGVTGGIFPYTYLWNDLDATTDSIADSLCTGSYFVETTDLNGCTDTAYVTIRDTSVFSISITDTTHVTCNSICNGGAIVTPILGSAPFTYAWTNPAATTDSTVTGLCAGVVNVTVTDSVGCIRFASVTINQPDSLIGTPMFTSPLCFGDTNGVAWVDVSGGTGPYLHAWDTTSVNDTVYNIGVGFYSDTITDINGCKDTVTVAVTEPAVLQAILDSANISCFGSADGTVWAEPTGGTTPYTYEWNDPSLATTDTVLGLDVGIYTAIVTDFNGCTDTDSVAITQPLPLASSITDTSHVACFCTGIASVTPTGGTSPYSYLWSNSSTDSTATGLCAGSYWVAVTDFNGCIDTSYVTIRDTSGFVTDIVDSIMNGCFGLCNGSALARAENGVQPYNFVWDDPVVTNDSLVNNLCEGTYTVTISDAVGCTHIESVTITAPDSIQISITDTMINCNGDCDGSAMVNLVGGTPPYYYDWLNPSLDDSGFVDSLCAGQYIVEVLDDNGCFVTDTANITEPAELIAFISPFNHVSCFGENDASLTALPTGGTAPYSYSWSSGEITQVITGKGPNLYSVNITDSLGCVDDTSMTILEPVVLASSITDTTHILCGGTLTGSATVTPTGGTAPYSYDWYDALGALTDSIAVNLPAGTYNVEVMDANGCSDTSEVTITEPVVFASSITNSTTTSCIVCDGTAAVTPTGGVLPYTYDWFNAPGSQTDSLAIDLCAAIYNVAVADANGCADTSQIVITGPGGLTAGVYDTSMVTCNGLSDGLAVATGIAGTAPYTYLWDDVATTANDSVTNLPIGTYNVTVTDNAGCIATAQVIITEPDVLIASIADTSATGCASPCTGSATAAVTGGTGPYTYLWDDWATQTGITATNICAGQYTVNVTDDNGCTDTSVAFVTGPGGLTVAVDSAINITCFGDCDGNAAITASGGVKPYDYLWNDPSFTADSVVTGLCGGIVNAQVTDANGCLAFANINIIEPLLLEVIITDSSDVTCNLGSNGWALASIAGGTAPYDISWNDAATQTTDSVIGLVAGTYTITVRDANGCTTSASVTIEQPTPLSVSTSGIQHVLCTGFCIGEATLTVSGGTIGSGYDYLWEDGQTSPAATGLCSGFQTYTVTDGAGCALIDSVEIEDLNDFTAVMSGTAASCSGDCDGSVLATPSGGTTPYVHSWNNGATSDAQSSLCPGVYIDTISDAGGCFLVDSFEVLDPSLMSVDIIDSANLSCFGLCDGMAVANAAGGTAPYTYTWYNAPVVQVNDTVVDLCANEYYVRAEDDNGCTAEDTITLVQPPRITVLLDASTAASCSNVCDATADVSATGGQGSLIVSWEDGDNSLSRSALCPGDYTVYATDDSSCVDSVEFTLGSPDTLFAIITDTSHLECSTVPSGSATVGQIGGTSPYNYDWYDLGGATSSIVTGLIADTFHVEVTDFNGCLDTAQVIINDDNALKANLIVTNISCNGLCDGKVVADVTGGLEPYVFNWVETGTSGDSIEGLCFGNYNLTVTDFNLCPSSASGFVIEPPVLSSSIVDSSNLDCFGVCDGFATVSPSGGTGPYTYQWNDPASQTGITATGLCAENYKVVVTDDRGCLDSSIAFLTEPAAITSSIIVNEATCTNTTDGSLDITASGGTPGYTFSWLGDGFSTADEDPTGLGIGQYNVVILDANGCSALDSAIVGEVNFINANAGNDTTICEGDSLQFNATGGLIYSWSDGGTSANHTVNPTTSRDYILTVFNSGCSDIDTITVNVNGKPDINVLANDNLILTGTTTQLLASGAGTGGTYDWEPPIGLDDPTIPNPIAAVTQGVNYIVTGTDVNGCLDTAMIRIDVATSIIFPDGITPNGDGLNETWVIQLIKEFPNATVQIFNRWGQKVFESVGYQNEWDGTMNGKKLPVGTYYYVIDLGPSMEKFTGPITLMR